MHDKASLRSLMLARRAALPVLDAPALEALAGRILACIPSSCRVLAGYADTRGDVPVDTVLAQAEARGMLVALPRVEGRHAPLSFRRLLPGARLAAGAFGILEPGAEAESLLPDALLIPLVAFDRHGYRLGYGGGYYDRTLAVLPAGCICIGVGQSALEMEALPVEAHDKRMDWVVTERECVRLA